MVDCPHLSKAVCIAKLDLEQLKRLGFGKITTGQKKLVFRSEIRNVFTSVNRSGASCDAKSKDSLEDGNWSCVQCGTSQCPWLCLACGLIHCGRYVNQDGLKHYNAYPSHSVSMDCYNYSVFCYQCDDFVGLDTEDCKIASVRSSLEFFNHSRSNDHCYSATTYESIGEPGEVVEISAEELPSLFCDEGTEEEEEEVGLSDDKKEKHWTYSSSVVETVEVPSANEEVDNNPASEAYRTNRVEFHLYPPNESKSSKDEESDSVLEEDFCIRGQSLTQDFSKSEPPSTAFSAPVLVSSTETSLTGENILRKRKRKESDSACDISASSSSLLASPSVAVPSKLTPILSQKLRGLKNLGNTCFMNSILQALNSIEIFRYFMCQLPPLQLSGHCEETVSAETSRYKTRSSVPPGGDNGDHAAFISEEIRKISIDIVHYSGNSNTSSAFGPDSLLTEVWKFAPRFRGFQQQDSHEFLRCILDRMHTELKRCVIPDWLVSEICHSGVRLSSGSFFKRKVRSERSDNNCIISAMFEGSLQSQVTCLSCNTTSDKQDPFLDLSLDILISTNVTRAGTVSLEQCLRHFFAKEELDSCDQYSCGKCCEKRPSTKQLFVTSLPNVLCLHLKRFSWSHQHRGKLDCMVDFPVTGLNMKNFMVSKMQKLNGTILRNTDSTSNGSTAGYSSTSNSDDEETIYDLYSIVVHHGSGLSCGHYTAYGLHNGQWYLFNDTSVKSCSVQLVQKQKAYLLFYCRRNRL